MLDPTVGQVLGDCTHFQQVIWNLLSNAVKFTPETGQVNIANESISSPSAPDMSPLTDKLIIL
ncbi:ATP-binding protein [Nostoc commune]|uniref:ATP-binding protein n=1 Tax=Nostoc commune TaxID=1178 RepID=UPI0018C6D93E|nr:ATP-binding protein [Nostoc commune]